MGTIVPFLKPDGAVFGPDDICAMSAALDDVCKRLKVDERSIAREIVAMRIVELARCGERRAARLRDQVLAELSSGSRC